MCYWYIVYGDASKAIPFAELSDVHDLEAADCLHKVSTSVRSFCTTLPDNLFGPSYCTSVIP